MVYMTIEEAREAVAAVINKFYKDLAYVAPEVYPTKFVELRRTIDYIISQID
jgi:hypothetical protein